jgi:ABC-type polysaccharide/polyol phosphate export permease
VTSAPTTDPSLVAADREEPFEAERHVYEPHRVGLPPLGPYLRGLWRRREFMFELSRTELRAQHFNTVFGQIWLILNPLLLACVYFILVDILRSRSGGIEFFAHLMSSLFIFQFVTDSMRQAVKSVTGGGKLILNTAFPRVLLPLSDVITAFMRFLPTLAIYIPVHLISGLPLGFVDLWVLPLLALMAILASGAAMLVAALQVYFRDLKNFLPYLLRIWLYMSPILYYAHEVPHGWNWLIDVNPLGGLLTAWSDVLNRGLTPDHRSIVLGFCWSVGIFLAGALFFVSREREFAVRL